MKSHSSCTCHWVCCVDLKYHITISFDWDIDLSNPLFTMSYLSGEHKHLTVTPLVSDLLLKTNVFVLLFLSVYILTWPHWLRAETTIYQTKKSLVEFLWSIFWEQIPKKFRRGFKTNVAHLHKQAWKSLDCGFLQNWRNVTSSPGIVMTDVS